MRVLALASQKGGSGKTTLSGHLAVQAQRAGAGPVVLIDIDPQGSLADWWNEREAEYPAFAQTTVARLAHDLQALREQGFKLAVIDTPPAITMAIQSVISVAELIVVPTRPSPHDLRAVGATVDLCERAGKPLLFVVNAATPTRRNNRKAVLGTAMAAVLIVGYGGSVNAAPNNPAHEISKKAQRNANKAIAAAEKQAAKRPQDAAVRASLGNAYLLAGRFESAVTAFEDARYLGDTSARSALGLSLSHVGVGNGAAAVSVLDSARNVIPVSDYGLALALAGETGLGFDVLSQALRGGENTSKLRQNLAYAYALDGRWNDARVMASQDVPLDKLDARITEWARQGRPEDFRLRVASMLGTTVRTDQGQPANLALSRDPTREVASLPVPRLASAPAAAGNGGELPPVDNRDEFWVAEATRPEPVTAPPVPALASAEVAASPPVPATNDFAAAFPKPTDQLAYTPVAAKAETALTAKAEPAVAAPQPVRKTRKVARANNIFPGVKAATGGSHLVQLGAFSSQANAERAWSIFRSRNPELAGFDRVMTQAIVGGKKYWRVSARGFDRNSARQMCTTVRNRGGGCIAWASGAPLPGAIRKD